MASNVESSGRPPPREELVRLHEEQRLTLGEIEARSGVNHQMISKLAKFYDVRLRYPRHHRISVTREWLYEQYVTHRRSLHDIARQLGVGRSTLGAWMKDHKIPTRRTGGRETALAQTRRLIEGGDQAPSLLRPTLFSAAALRRLEHFAATSRHPSSKPQQSAGMDVGTFAAQTRRLERDLGGTVLILGTQQQPLRLTPFGE
ncbi:hypothetical protein ACSNOH_02145 [Streptomyces sp. URMC 127]|uniref:hypothetical protein n=1 Tax=Streptomyces sp. URMC 127 TaxID=3423402 RepID=UPI003F1CA903